MRQEGVKRMRTRYLDQKKKASRTLYGSFPSDRKRICRLLLSGKMRDNRVLILEEEGTGPLHAAFKSVYGVGEGQRYPSEYIVAVATDAAYRHRGYSPPAGTRPFGYESGRKALCLSDARGRGRSTCRLASGRFHPRSVASLCRTGKRGSSRPAGADDAARLATLMKYLRPNYDIVTVRMPPITEGSLPSS